MNKCGLWSAKCSRRHSWGACVISAPGFSRTWAYSILSQSALIPFRSWAYYASHSATESSEELDSRFNEINKISEISDYGVESVVWDSPELDAELGLLSSIPCHTFSSLAITIRMVVSFNCFRILSVWKSSPRTYKRLELNWTLTEKDQDWKRPKSIFLGLGLGLVVCQISSDWKKTGLNQSFWQLVAHKSQE